MHLTDLCHNIRIEGTALEEEITFSHLPDNHNTEQVASLITEFDQNIPQKIQAALLTTENVIASP